MDEANKFEPLKDTLFSKINTKCRNYSHVNSKVRCNCILCVNLVSG